MRTERIRRHYESRIDPSRENFDVLDWGSREAQEARFAALAAVLRAMAATTRAGVPTVGTVQPAPCLLDVGCGLADLRRYLAERELDIRYVGVDLTLAILREARRRSGKVALLQADAIAAPPFRSGSIDVVFCSGVFNLNLGNNREFIGHALPRLTRLATRCVVANFLHVRTAHRYPHCFYTDPETVGACVAGHVRSVEVRDDYLPNDFTVVLHV